MSSLGISGATSILYSAFDKQTNVNKKILDIKRQLEVQLNAYTASLPDIEKDKGYCYYSSEKDRIERKRENESSSFDCKIATLEAKKKALIEEIDSRIEKIEKEKKILEEKLDGERLRYENEMKRLREKFETAEPQTQSYKKLQSSLLIAERELDEANKEIRDAHHQYEISQEKIKSRVLHEQDIKQREILRIERIEKDEAVQRAEERSKREHEEYMVRYNQRETNKNITEVVETIYTPPPPEIKKVEGGVKKAGKKVEGRVSFPLNVRTKYSVKQLDQLQDEYIDREEDFPDDQQDVFNRCFAYAMRREDKTGWQIDKYNHENEQRDGDIMSEKEFANIFK